MEKETKVALIGAVATIIVAMISSPYILPKTDTAFRPSGDSSLGSTPAIPSGPVPAGPPIRGSITVDANSYPRTVSPGRSSQISVLAMVNSQRLPEADVKIGTGGGYFEDTGTTITTGKTDRSGVFKAIWHTYEASAYSSDMSYILDIVVEKPGYETGKAEVEIFIRVH